MITGPYPLPECPSGPNGEREADGRNSKQESLNRKREVVEEGSIEQSLSRRKECKTQSLSRQEECKTTMIE